jgi:predicted alpha-1,6-mannanase (GH76 family)
LTFFIFYCYVIRLLFFFSHNIPEAVCKNNPGMLNLGLHMRPNNVNKIKTEFEYFQGVRVGVRLDLIIDCNIIMDILHSTPTWAQYVAHYKLIVK